MEGQQNIFDLMKEEQPKGCPYELAQTQEEQREVWEKICRVVAVRCMAERTAGWRLGYTCLDCEHYKDAVKYKYRK